MKKRVLLISNKVYHYRVPIYNYFYKEFNKNDIDFSLLTYELQKDNPNPIDFTYSVIKPSFKRYTTHINTVKPDAVIFFMHLKDWIMWPLLVYLKWKNIPIIKWGHGINLKEPDNKMKNSLYALIYRFCSAIILYSPMQKKFLKKHQDKIFIANNTLNFEAFPKIDKTKSEIKKELNVSYETVILFVGRITADKQLDVLIEIFKTFAVPDAGLVIVGPDMTEKQLTIVSSSSNMTYLGPVYDEKKINYIFKMSDIFCIPGKNGLGLNQAMYWGLPVVTMEGVHAPEIVYLKNGFNGFLTEKKTTALQQKLEWLAQNKDNRLELSKNAHETMLNEGNIRNMFSGFLQAVHYVWKNNNH